MPKDNKHNEDKTQKLLQEQLKKAEEQNGENPIGQFLLNHLTNLNKATNNAQARMIDPVSVKQINVLKELFSSMEGVKIEIINDEFRNCFMFSAESDTPIQLNEQQIEKFYPLLEHSILLWAGYDEITETHGIEIDYPQYVFKW